MTQEEKQLLLQDLCARWPYGVKISVNGNIETLDSICDDDGFRFQFLSEEGVTEGFPIENIKPYLRPMESMTEEDFQKLHSICPHSTFNKTNVSGWVVGISGSDYGRISRVDEISEFIDWLNKKMFDYRGLIPMGLALPAKEGMYQ